MQSGRMRRDVVLIFTGEERVNDFRFIVRDGIWEARVEL